MLFCVVLIAGNQISRQFCHPFRRNSQVQIPHQIIQIQTACIRKLDLDSGKIHHSGKVQSVSIHLEQVGKIHCSGQTA